MAKKPTISAVTGGYMSAADINTKLQSLASAFDNTLSRDGSTPNAMTADIDLNGNKLLNAEEIRTSELYVNGVRLVDAVQAPSWQGAWTTATEYGIGVLVSYNGRTYIAVETHTSDVFLTDLNSGKWEVFSAEASRVFDTLADLVASPDLIVGQVVSTRGYSAIGDGGANDYTIVPTATGTADGGSYINLTGISGQAEGIFPNKFVNTRQFGHPASGDASVAIQAASDFAVTLRTSDTPSSAVKLAITGLVELANPVTLGGVAYFNVDTLAARIEVITGGDLESNPEQAAVTILASNSEHHLGAIVCNRICGGLRISNSTNTRIFGPRVDFFTWRGLTVDTDDGNCAGASFYGFTGREYGNGETEFNDSASFVSVGIYNDANDTRFIAAHVGYCGYPIINGPSGNGATFLECHPFNGNQNSGAERRNPIDFINLCPNRVWCYDCYFDNGNVIDTTGSLTIKNSWNVELNSIVPAPVVRVNVDSTSDDVRGTIENSSLTVGYYSDAWMGSDPDEPLVVFAMGEGNMNGNADAADEATFQVNDNVHIWSKGALGVGSNQFIDPVYGSHPLNNGGESLAISFCNQLTNVTRRPVYLVLMSRTSSNIESWITPATNSSNGWTASYNVTANAYPAFAAALAAVPGRTTAYADFVIWHQGESNSADSSTVYKNKFLAMKSDLEATGTIDASATRIIAGGLLTGVSNRATIESAIREVMTTEANVRFAESDNLDAAATSSVHFSGSAIRTFADRYYWAGVVYGDWNYSYSGMSDNENKRVTSRARHTLLSLDDSDPITRHEVRAGDSSTYIEHQFSPGVGLRSNVKYSNGTAAFFEPTSEYGEVRVAETGIVGISTDAGTFPLVFKSGGSSRWRINGSGNLLPEVDNIYNIGTGALRIKELFAGTGTINTSDETEKEQITSISDTVLDAWGDVEWKVFKYKDAVLEKGEDARIHSGLIAQDIKTAFENHGLNPFDYGVLCFDQWEGGARYGVRYNEAEAFESAWQRREITRMKARLNILELP